jgi:hypothetical protein
MGLWGPFHLKMPLACVFALDSQRSSWILNNEYFNRRFDCSKSDDCNDPAIWESEDSKIPHESQVCREKHSLGGGGYIIKIWIKTCKIPWGSPTLALLPNFMGASWKFTRLNPIILYEENGTCADSTNPKSQRVKVYNFCNANSMGMQC